jgi:hypothetical protein
MVIKNETTSNTTMISGETPIKKRGRKPKKDIQNNNEKEENIVVTFEENNNLNLNINEIINLNNDVINITETNSIFLQKDDSLNQKKEPAIKKRGRKPKGGKIIQQLTPFTNVKESKPNIILHLKCSLNDLNPPSNFNSNIQSYQFSSNKTQESYEIISNNDFLDKINNNLNNSYCNLTTNTGNNEFEYNEYDTNDKCKESDTKEVWKKLKQLEHDLHINNVSGKKSACFWCTYDFDNPPIYIPKFYFKDTYNVYGCFCSPECATAYLMNENIDTSIKFERFHLLNNIYSKIYDYKKNIKPAPMPYYILDKYYGNLSIQEYRALLKNDRLFLVVDKPLTRTLPELHEDNDDFIINNKIIPSNSYQVNKKLQKKQQNKNSILNENFGLQ